MEENEEIWMDDLESGSISSENSSKSAARPNHRQMYQHQLWREDDVIRAISDLPAGEIALSQLSTLNGEQLEKVIEETQKLDFSETKVKNQMLLIPRFANGGIRKASIAAENESAATATPEELLSKWPNTCLLVSTWLGQMELVKLLLEKGAEVSFRDNDGRTSLHLAACIGSEKIVQELLRFGADPSEWDFHRTCTSLHCAAASGDVETVKILLEAGADVNAGIMGRSPLHYAVLSNNSNCVETLLKAGASPNNPQVYTETPLHVAASLGSATCVNLLLSFGADVRVQMGAARSTPLHLSAEEGSAECTKLLLDHQAAHDAKNSKGQTPLHLAALAQSAETMEILISREANVNEEDVDGRTPLHAAVAKSIRGCELVKMLIQAGAEINKADKFGYTPLHIAALSESSSTVMLLVSKAADVTARTKGGISALSFIIRRTPDILPRFIARLDQAISLHDHELGDVDCELRLDFRALVPGGRGETDLMLCLVEVGQRHVLKHPLCESFLYLKWLRIRKFFLFSLVFHSIFVAMFTSYIAFTFFWKLTDMSDIFFWPVIMFTIILACKEIFQLAHGVCSYAKGWENVLQWSVIVTSGIILCQVSQVWHHHIAALGVLLVWVELMMVVGRFPMFGIYVQMFTQVALNFFKFLGAYMSLIIGFSLSFSVLHDNYKSFKNPLVGLLKTIIMMSGELEFEDVFFDDEARILYPGTAHLMLLAFVILVTIILTNLMMGLAVSDIQELRRCAGLDRLIRRAQLVAHLENLLFSKLLDFAPKKIVKVCRSGALLLHLPHHCAIHIRPNDPRENRLPRDLIKSVYRLVSERRNKLKKPGNSLLTRSANDIEMSDVKLNRLYSSNSVNDSNRQLSEIANELKRCAQTISARLDSLTTKVEYIAREIDLSITN